MFPALKKSPRVDTESRKEAAPTVIVEPCIYPEPFTVKRESMVLEDKKREREFT